MAIDKTTGLWTPQVSGGGGDEELQAEITELRNEIQSVKAEVANAVTELGGI